MPRIPRALLPAALLGLTAALGYAPVAHADPAAAEALFQQGRALLERGDVGAACAKFESSQASEPSAGTLLNLADCRARQGRTATAWAHFVAAERLSEMQSRPEQAAEAKRRRSELEPTLSTLTVRAAEPPPELEVRVNGRKLDAASLDARLPMDPGTLSIDFNAPGRAPARVEVQLRPSAHHLVVDLPRLEPEAARPTESSSEQPGTAPPAAPSEARRSKTLAWVIGGAGLAALAVGGTFGVMALGSNADAKNACDQRTTACPPSAMQAEEDRDRQALISTIGVAAGIVGLGISAVLLLTDTSSTDQPMPASRLGLEVAPGKAVIFGSARF